MGLFYDKATFRVRALTREWLCDRPRTVYWRALGLRVGPGTLLPRIRVTWPHQVSLGARCVLEPDIFFRFNGIWESGPAITIGDDSFIGTGCEFNARKKIAIGSHALIASGCRFIDHDHGYSSRTQPMAEQVDGGEDPIILENDVWLGVNAVVLKGVTIGRGAIVAAGSVVTKSIGAYEMWAGVPARKIRVRPDAAA
jgi:acetyltransferase-like isoleucine patch superfamily enzyme